MIVFIADRALHFVDRRSFSLFETMEPFPIRRLTRQEVERAAIDLGARFSDSSAMALSCLPFDN
jgi:hypothetical protein